MPATAALLSVLFACSSGTLRIDDGKLKPDEHTEGDTGSESPDGGSGSDGGGGDGGSDGGGSDGGGSDGGSDDGGTEVEVEVDADGDGYTSSEGDCDDSNPDISPGGDEGDRADGVDQDCTGTADDRLVCASGDADHRRIQVAIDQAPLDFVLRICPGEYVENLEIAQRVTLQSTDGADVTIVRAASEGPVLRLSSVAAGPEGQVVGVKGLTLRGGRAVRGGGVLAEDTALLLQDNVITRNDAQRGGGAWLQDCTGEVVGNTLSDNSALEAGGLGVWNGYVDVHDNRFEANTATTTDEGTYGSGSGGGGMLLYGNGPLRDNEFDGNSSAYNGGGLYVLYGRGDVSGNILTGNSSGEDGGGAYFNQAASTIQDNLFWGNLANDDAGGLRCYVCSVEISGNEFLENQAADDAGGMKLSHSYNVLYDNWFEGNQAGDAGGGLELDNDTSDVTDSTFIDNLATRGGGLHSWRCEGTLTLQDLHFEGNQATDCGGAIELDNDPWLVSLVRITAWENTAVDGGAICTDAYEQDDGTVDDTRLSLRASLLVDNQASDDGGAVHFRSASVSLVNVTIADNSAAQGAVALKDGTLSIQNSVVSGTDGAEGVRVEGGQLDVAWSNLYGNDGGPTSGVDDPVGLNGNLAVDPDYVDPTSGDYSLSPASPLIDAGDPGLTDTDGTRSDIGHTGGPDAG